MGGFHGGHGGGHSGGFHGGSHHSYHSYSGGYSSRPIVKHTIVNGHHYLNGVRHYGGYYGIDAYGKPRSFSSKIASGVLFAIIGLVLFIFLFKLPCDAVVTRAEKAYDYTYYEVYDFDYNYLGKTYHGHGDDDLGYNGFTVNVGEHYTVYVSPFVPSSYSFENHSVFAIIALIAGIGVSVIIIVPTIKEYIRHQRELEAVGDANGDGVVNDTDLEYVDLMNHGKAEGAYVGNKKAEEEKNYIKNRARCPYCDAIVTVNDKFCSKCGSNLK